MMPDAIKRPVETGADSDRRTVDLARRLIAIPTISQDPNLELIDFIAGYLRDRGVKYDIQKDACGLKANLVATIGPPDRPGVILAGHTDVVPVDDQDWTHDPFDPVLRDGRIYGRGSCDMKGFIAAVLSRIDRMCGRHLQTPIHLLLTYDEEVGCGGARQAVRTLTVDWKTRPLACIVGEPTGMEIVAAHRGISLLRTTVRGRAAHSSVPAVGVNSIILTARLATFLDDLAKRVGATSGREKSDFRHQGLTVNLGVIRGGTAFNIVAELTQLDWEFRYTEPELEQRVFDELKEYCLDLQRCGGEHARIFTEVVAAVPSLSNTNNADLVRLLVKLTGLSGPRQVDYCTEGGLYQEQLGVPTVICGPGSIAQAHQADEYLEIGELNRAGALIDDVIAACESGAWMTLAR